MVLHVIQSPNSSKYFKERILLLDLSMNPEVEKYYNSIAAKYDQDRFGNTYGKFIDTCEHRIVKRAVRNIPTDEILDAACGTGRFLKYANTGLDLSESMLNVAGKNYKDKNLVHSSATNTPFGDESFRAVLCFHLIRHLDKTTTRKVFDEMYRILKPGGKFIVDVPSRDRRKISGYTSSGWHGSNDFMRKDLKILFGEKWKLKKSTGVMLIPIHRFPHFFRKALISIDALLCKTFIQRYASYWVLELERK